MQPCEPSAIRTAAAAVKKDDFMGLPPPHTERTPWQNLQAFVLTGLHGLDLIFDLDTEGDRQVASLRLLPADPILRLAEKSFEYG
jgi:hypothetical protein